jgi:hypothetical protein
MPTLPRRAFPAQEMCNFSRKTARLIKSCSHPPPVADELWQLPMQLGIPILILYVLLFVEEQPV